MKKTAIFWKNMIRLKIAGSAAPSLPRPLHHVGAASVGGKIYVIGGYISGEGPVNTVYEYDPAIDQWRMRAAMPTREVHWPSVWSRARSTPSAASARIAETRTPTKPMIPPKIVG